MSGSNSLGHFLEELSHDIKNHLGILQTLLEDHKQGYQLDQESIDNGIIAVQKIKLVSSILQKGAKLCSDEEISPDNFSKQKISQILTLVSEAITHQSQNIKLNEKGTAFVIRMVDDETKESYEKTFFASLKNQDSNNEKNLVLFEEIKKTFNTLLEKPISTNSVSRNALSLFKLLLSIEGVSKYTLKLEHGHEHSC